MIRRACVPWSSQRARGQEDDISARIAKVAEWRRVDGFSTEELTQAVRGAGVQILFDMSGHTAGHRRGLFAAKAAPIQISWLGYVGTTGLRAMDYVLADAIQAPAGTEAHYSEKIIRLPHGYACFDPPADIAFARTPPAARNGHITFGSFNNPAKLSGAVIESYGRILTRVPGSKLLLKFRGLEDEGVQKRLRADFAREGIAEDRIVIEGRAPLSCGHTTGSTSPSTPFPIQGSYDLRSPVDGLSRGDLSGRDLRRASCRKLPHACGDGRPGRTGTRSVRNFGGGPRPGPHTRKRITNIFAGEGERNLVRRTALCRRLHRRDG